MLLHQRRNKMNNANVELLKNYISKGYKGEIKPYDDLRRLCKQLGDIDNLRWLRTQIESVYGDTLKSHDLLEIKKVREEYKIILTTLGKFDFDSYLLALEWNRKPEERFYSPRRKQLKQIVDAIQEMADGKLDELFFSQPARTGKSTLMILATTWFVGRNSELANLYSAYSDKITSAFYNACLEIIQDKDTYRWGEIFTGCGVAGTNGKDLTFDINRKKHYPSVTARSVHGTLNGACDCSGIMIIDDVVSGIEEALSPDRMASLWHIVDNNLLPRGKEKMIGKIWIGTRWSTLDPSALRCELFKGRDEYKNIRYKAIYIPALNENDESNFNYDYNVGFSTEYYKARRASFEENNDMASWFAQYQQAPIEREGTVFDAGNLIFYNGVLPTDDRLIRKFMVVDPAFGGGDFTASPIVYQYIDGIYIVDVVFNDGDKKITQKEIVEKAIKHDVGQIQFAVNKMTMSYKEEVEKKLKEKGKRISVTSKNDPNNKAKEARIFDKAPTIREFYFLASNLQDKEYKQFMSNVYSFSITGRNKHDDAPDSLAMVAVFIETPQQAKVEFMRRLW